MYCTEWNSQAHIYLHTCLQAEVMYERVTIGVIPIPYDVVQWYPKVTSVPKNHQQIYITISPFK